jgi:hypothetical protein
VSGAKGSNYRTAIGSWLYAAWCKSTMRRFAQSLGKSLQVALVLLSTRNRREARSISGEKLLLFVFF